jgi:thiamine-phosphate pyrophosphorylase
MRPRVDWSLYLVTDRALALGRPIEWVVAEAVAGGVTVVQLREKDCSTREFVALARRLVAMLSPLGVPLIINDRADVALAVGADGLHIGQSDMDYADARRIMGPDAIIGLSAQTTQEAVAAERLDVDCLGVGPIFATTTKEVDNPPWGPEGLRDLRARSRHALVGIGGINASNAASVIRAGADGVAVVSAICSAPDPRNAARELREIITHARKE